jgi:hypothetical protein
MSSSLVPLISAQWMSSVRTDGRTHGLNGAASTNVPNLSVVTMTPLDLLVPALAIRQSYANPTALEYIAGEAFGRRSTRPLLQVA